jgi:hypothetical protein
MKKMRTALFEDDRLDLSQKGGKCFSEPIVICRTGTRTVVTCVEFTSPYTTAKIVGKEATAI